MENDPLSEVKKINEGIVSNSQHLQDTTQSVHFNDAPSQKVQLKSDAQSTEREISEQNSDDEWVNINVKGVRFFTTKETLTKHFPSSYLARIFNGNAECEKDESGAYVLLAEPDYFREILNYLRRRKFCVPEHHLRGLAADAHYFGLLEMVDEVEKMRAISSSDISSKDVCTPYKCTICEAVFWSHGECKKHFKNIHEYKCKFCGQGGFTSASNRDIHVKRYHLYNCELCHQVFMSELGRREHSCHVFNIFGKYCNLTQQYWKFAV